MPSVLLDASTQHAGDDYERAGIRSNASPLQCQTYLVVEVEVDARAVDGSGRGRGSFPRWTRGVTVIIGRSLLRGGGAGNASSSAVAA